MDNQYSILQLIPRGDPDALDQMIALVEGLDASRWRLLVAGMLTPRLRERLGARQIPWINLAIPAGRPSRRDRAAGAQFQRLISARDVDLVHCHSLAATAIAVRARYSGRPIVASLHAAAQSTLDQASRHWSRRAGLRRLLNRCAAVIVSSQRDRELLQRLAPHAGRSTHVIYPSPERSLSRPYEAGVKRRQVGLHQDAAIVGLVSRLEPGQGVEEFLQAAALVNADLPNVEFVVMGEGSGRAALEKLVHELGLGGACVFLGERRDARQIVEALNVVVLLSDADRAPLRALQALAAGLPLIAARSGPLVQLFSDLPRAHLADVSDAGQLAAAIRRQLLAPPETGDAEIIVEGHRSITYRDFLVSTVEYDLEEPWSGAAGVGQDDSAISRAVRQHYGPERMISEIESVYYQVLEE